MTLLTLLLIFVATTALSLALAAFFAWLANGMRGGRAAWIIAASFHVTYFVIGGLAVLAYVVTENASRGVREILPPAALLSLLVGPVVALARGFRKRMGMRSGKAIAATVMVLVGSGGLQYGVAVALRAAVVEAFIVPTGALAPTVYGQHQKVTCIHCGLKFAVGARGTDPFGNATSNPEPIELPCPNCGLTATIHARAPIASGDRILADKTAAPKRWDLIIFGNPDDPRFKYVSRLVGQPRERIEIRGGEVYVNADLLRKSLDARDDLWFPVHDTALVVYKGDVPIAGWRLRSDRGDGMFEDTPITLDETGNAWVYFTGRITNAMPYNGEPRGVGNDDELVDDVRIEIDFERYSEKATMSLTCPYGDGQVSFEMTGEGDVKITHSGGATESARVKRDASGSRVAFVIRDGRAGVVGDAMIVSLDIGPAASADASEGALIKLSASGGTVTCDRIRIWRDVYYTDPSRHSEFELGTDEYFVLGDNSVVSKDSRFIGPVPAGNLIGVARWRYWPPRRWHAFDSPMGD